MSSLSNIRLSKTYVKDGGDTVRFSFTVSQATNLATKYQIYLDTTLLKENTSTITPYSVSEDIVLTTGGTIKISLTDSNNVVTDFTYDVYSENRDTFSLIRRLEYDTSTVVSGTVINGSTGINIAAGSTTGALLLEVPTVGKAKVSSIVVDGTTDGAATTNIVVPSETPVSLTDYTEYSYPVTKTKYDAINSFTINDSDNTLTMNATFHSTKTIQISKDGITFMGYNGTIWTSEYLMTEVQFEALTAAEYAKFHTTAYNERLFIKMNLDSNNTVTPMLVSKVTTNFAANEPPIIDQIALSLTSIHNDSTSISAYLYDNEGDTIEYKVLIKAEADVSFTQVTPETGWSSVANMTNITHTYNKDNFKLGNNSIKIQARDQRGSIRESNVLTLQVVNSSPIQTTYVCNDFFLQALISDVNEDQLAYRVFINGVQKYPATGYTEYQPSPRLIDYSWNSDDLKFGLNNEIKLEVVDQFGATLELASTVLGTYKGLLFKDELGNYYTSDSGALIKYIDLGSHIASSKTTPKQVVLENRTGTAVGNIKLKVSDETKYDGINMSISPILTPFDGVSDFIVPYTLNHGDQFNFWVRVDLDRHVSRTGEVVLKLEVE